MTESNMMNDPKQATIDVYNRTARLWDESKQLFFWKEKFDDFVQLVQGKRVIDIGCGTGKDAHLFIDAGFDYVGIDLSKKMLEVAKEREPRANFQLMDLYHLDFPSRSFDGFWADTSLLHVPKKDIGHVLESIKKLLKTGGVGFISMKQVGDKGNVVDGIAHEHRFGMEFDRYFALYTIDEFKHILEDVGFAIVKNHVYKKANKNWLCYFVSNA